MIGADGNDGCEQENLSTRIGTASTFHVVNTSVPEGACLHRNIDSKGRPAEAKSYNECVKTISGQSQTKVPIACVGNLCVHAFPSPN